MTQAQLFAKMRAISGPAFDHHEFKYYRLREKTSPARRAKASLMLNARLSLQARYEALQAQEQPLLAQEQALRAELEALRAELEALRAELDRIKDQSDPIGLEHRYQLTDPYFVIAWGDTQEELLEDFAAWWRDHTAVCGRVVAGSSLADADVEAAP